MGVSNGQKANQTTFNNAFLSRTTDSNTIGKVDLDSADAASGASIANVQRELNSGGSYTGKPLNAPKDAKPSWTDTSAGTPTDDLTERSEALTVKAGQLTTQLSANDAETASLRTLSGTSPGANDLGTFAGSTISDNVDTKAALGELETLAEANATDIDDLEALSGSPGLTNHGTFTGTTIPDSSTTKAALQSLETEVETKIPSSEKGSANGVATLDGGGKVPSSQLPSYVDDVEEYANQASFPVTGETGKIYVAIDTNEIFRWTGSVYIEIADSPSLSIDDLTDVDTSTVAPTNGQLLSWNSGSGNWEPANAPSSGANTSLSNLTTTSVNQDLLPSSSGSRNFGSPSLNWSSGFFRQVRVHDNGGSLMAFFIRLGVTPSGGTNDAAIAGEPGKHVHLITQNSSSTSVATGNAGVETGNATTTGIGTSGTGSIKIKTGNVTGATNSGNTGDLSLEVGTVSTGGGSRGKIKFKDGSEGSIGKVWTSVGVDGEGSWLPSSGGGVGAKNFIPPADSQMTDGAPGWFAYDDGGAYVNGFGESSTPSFISAAVISQPTSIVGHSPSVSSGPIWTTTSTLNDYVAQEFLTPSSPGAANYVDLYLFRTSGTSPTHSNSGRFKIQLRTDDGGSPSKPTSSVLTETAIMYGFDLPTGKQLSRYYFKDNVSLSGGTKYWFVLVPVEIPTDTSGAIYRYYDAAGGYADGDYATSNNGGAAWSAFPTQDFAFEVGFVSPTILDGDSSLEITKAIGDATGEGVSVMTERISRQYMGRELHGSIEVDFTDAAYVSGDVVLKAYDITNGTELGILNDDDGAISKMRGKIQFRILPLDNTEWIRLSLHQLTDSASGSSWKCYIDDLRLGPQGSVPGAIMYTQDFTPDFRMSGTSIGLGAGTQKGHLQRRGSKTFFKAYFSLGAGFSVPAGTLELILPNGLTIDTTKEPGISSNSPLGGWKIHDAGANRFVGYVNYATANKVIFDYFSVGGTSAPVGANTYVSDGAPQSGGWASGDEFECWFEVSIVNQLDTALISTTENFLKPGLASYYGSFGGAYPTTDTVANYGTKIFDDQNLVTTGASWQYKCPKKGRYQVYACTHAASSGAITAFLRIRKNGSAQATGGFPSNSAIGNMSVQSTKIIDCEKDDLIDVVHGSSAATGTYTGGADLHYVEIFRIDDTKQWGTFGEFETKSAASSAKTPAGSATWMNMVGNSLELGPGIWELLPSSAYYGNNGVSADYTAKHIAWFSANGTDTGTSPASLDSSPYIDVLSSNTDGAHLSYLPSTSIAGHQTTPSVIIQVTQSVTVYLVPRADMGTPGNARVFAYPNAKRLV